MDRNIFKTIILLKYPKCLIAGIIAIVYYNAIFCDFVFDDFPAILNNPDVTAGWKNLDILKCLTIIYQLFGFYLDLKIFNTLNISAPNDNERNLTSKSVILALKPWIDIWKHDYWGNDIREEMSHKSYRPLTTLTFRLNYALNQKAWSFHLCNVVLHGIACILIYRFTNMLLPVSVDNCEKKRNENIAIWTTILFAVNPIHCDAVTSIVGRSEILSCICVLIALICCVQHNKGFSIASLFFGLCAMLLKEQGITVILIMATYCFVKWLTCPKSNLKALLLHQTCYFLGMISCLLLRFWIMAFQTPKFFKYDNPNSFERNWKNKLLHNSYRFALNYWKIVWPFALSCDWSGNAIPLIHGINDTRNLLTLMILLLILVKAYLITKLVVRRLPLFSKPATALCYTVLKNNSSSINYNNNKNYNYTKNNPSERNNSINNEKELIEINFGKKMPTSIPNKEKNIIPPLSVEQNAKSNNYITKHILFITMGFGIAYIPFIPSSNLFFSVGFVLAERVLYIPSLGITMLLIWILLQIPKDNRSLKIVQIILASITFIYGTKCYFRNQDWKNNHSLMLSATRVVPLNAKPWNNLGLYYEENQNDLKQALCCYNQALILQSNDVGTIMNIARIYSKSDRLKLSVETYKKAVYELEKHLNAIENEGVLPFHWPKAYSLLAKLYHRTHQLSSADILYHKYLKIYPQDYQIQLFHMFLNSGKSHAQNINMDQFSANSKALTYAQIMLLITDKNEPNSVIDFLETFTEINFCPLAPLKILLDNIKNGEVIKTVLSLLHNLCSAPDALQNNDQNAQYERFITDYLIGLPSNVSLKGFTEQFFLSFNNVYRLLYTQFTQIKNDNTANYVEQNLIETMDIMLKQYPYNHKGLYLVAEIYTKYFKDFEKALYIYHKLISPHIKQNKPEDIREQFVIRHNVCLLYLQMTLFSEAQSCINVLYNESFVKSGPFEPYKSLVAFSKNKYFTSTLIGNSVM